MIKKQNYTTGKRKLTGVALHNKLKSKTGGKKRFVKLAYMSIHNGPPPVDLRSKRVKLSNKKTQSGKTKDKSGNMLNDDGDDIADETSVGVSVHTFSVSSPTALILSQQSHDVDSQPLLCLSQQSNDDNSTMDLLQPKELQNELMAPVRHCPKKTGKHIIKKKIQNT